MHSSIDSTPQDEAPVIRSGRDGRLCFDPSHREALLNSFEGSGMSAMAFAAQHGVKYPTFMAWRKKRRLNADGNPQDGPAFAEVMVNVPASSSGEALRVVLPCGTSIEITGRASLTLAAELIRSLRGSC